jgi:ribonuclease HI
MLVFADNRSLGGPRRRSQRTRAPDHEPAMDVGVRTRRGQGEATTKSVNAGNREVQTMPTLECDVTTARERLEAAGVAVEPGNTDHERWRASRDGATAVAYDGKVLIQGSNPAAIEALISEAAGRAHVYFDGGARGNPGPAAIGWVVVTSDGIVAEGNETIGRATNNQAEYEALVRALDVAREYGFDEVDVRGDSELIVRQVTGKYDVHDPALREYRVTVRELLDAFEAWSLEHVPREINERADELVNDALDDA